jgi:hypothetical protein
MMAPDRQADGSALGKVPAGMRGLVRAVRREGLQPRDPRVKFLWDLLRQRQLLSRSRWLRSLLLLMWQRGLPPRQRPVTARRLVQLLTRWGIAQPRAGAAVGPPWVVRPGVRLPLRRRRRRPGMRLPVRPLWVRPGVRRPIRPLWRPAVRAPLRPVKWRAPLRARPVAFRPVATRLRRR